MIPLDVTSSADIKAAFKKALDAFGRIDVVYNNAAGFQSGEAEAIPEEAARRLFDVNYWGAVNVTLEAIRIFREVNKPQGGRILTVSSATGFAPVPGSNFYASSKFGMYTLSTFYTSCDVLIFPIIAIEGFTDAVRMELDPAWNIKVYLASDISQHKLTRIFTSSPSSNLEVTIPVGKRVLKRSHLIPRTLPNTCQRPKVAPISRTSRASKETQKKPFR